MNTVISQPDLTKLALQSSKVVLGLDFPDQENYLEQRELLMSLLESLQCKYNKGPDNSELLFDAHAALRSQPVNKLAIYSIVRDILNLARGANTPCAYRQESAVAVDQQRSSHHNVYTGATM